MDRNERVLDPEETLRGAIEAVLSRAWTALPCVVQAVTNSGNTLEVQPAINGSVRQRDGTFKPIQMPKLVDVPILWQGGGGATWTFPIAKGDECLTIFSSRCIDNWWKNGFKVPTGILGADGKPMNPANNPPEFRMLNLSDGFAFVGVRSLPRALASFNTTTARLRTDDNSCYLDFDPVNKKLTAVFPGGITLNNVTIDSSGNVVSPGTIQGTTVTGTTQVVAGSGGSAIHLTTHTHPSNGAPPTAGT